MLYNDLLLPCNGAFGSGTEAKVANLLQDTEERVSASHRFAFGLMNLWQTRTRIMVAVGLNTSNDVTVIGYRVTEPRFSRWRTTFLPTTSFHSITARHLNAALCILNAFIYRTLFARAIN